MGELFLPITMESIRQLIATTGESIILGGWFDFLGAPGGGFERCSISILVCWIFLFGFID